jgi:hypothetical protein
MACLGKTETTDLEANPEEMQCEAVHREVPKEDATVETGRTPNKRHRGRHLAAERRHKPKDGSWRKLAATRRGTTHRAGVARHKGHIVRKNQTRDKAGQGTLIRQMFGRRCQPKPESKSGIKGLGIR